MFPLPLFIHQCNFLPCIEELALGSSSQNKKWLSVADVTLPPTRVQTLAPNLSCRPFVASVPFFPLLGMYVGRRWCCSGVLLFALSPNTELGACACPSPSFFSYASPPRKHSLLATLSVFIYFTVSFFFLPLLVYLFVFSFLPFYLLNSFLSPSFPLFFFCPFALPTAILLFHSSSTASLQFLPFFPFPSPSHNFSSLFSLFSSSSHLSLLFLFTLLLRF